MEPVMGWEHKRGFLALLRVSKAGSEQMSLPAPKKIKNAGARCSKSKFRMDYSRKGAGMAIMATTVYSMCFPRHFLI